MTKYSIPNSCYLFGKMDRKTAYLRMKELLFKQAVVPATQEEVSELYALSSYHTNILLNMNLSGYEKKGLIPVPSRLVFYEAADGMTFKSEKEALEHERKFGTTENMIKKCNSMVHALKGTSGAEADQMYEDYFASVPQAYVDLYS